jgi:1-acyl-sn-glycerol-3-phosphate acyltransferase
MRKFFFASTFVIMTGALIAVQWLLGTLRLPGRRLVTLGYYRLLCSLLRVRVRVVGSPVRDAPVLIVGNHVSWLDIPVIGSVAPVAFVAKSEVAEWPVVGTAAKIVGTIFVDRKRRQQTANANAEIASRLNAGDPVMLFAEGTSSDGNRVLQFRSALVGAVKDALASGAAARQLWVQPLSICYTRQQGLPLGRQHRPVVAWYGDLDFIPHLVEFLSRGAVDAVVTFGAPIPYGADADRKVMVKSLERTVRRITGETLRERPDRAA